MNIKNKRLLEIIEKRLKCKIIEITNDGKIYTDISNKPLLLIKKERYYKVENELGETLEVISKDTFDLSNVFTPSMDFLFEE
jgi:hypothetical protein